MSRPVAVLLVMFASAALAAPPLTDQQRLQLSTASDGVGFDEGALYPLLANAAEWDPFDDRGAVRPDYAELRANPAAYRGAIFLVQGQFLRQRELGIARPDEQRWGDKLVEWSIKVGPDPGDVAVVFFVDPHDKMMEPPNVGGRVRTAARFYKVWGDRDQAGEPTRFLTFVAPAAALTDVPGGGQPTPSAAGRRALIPPALAAPLLLLLLIALAVVWWLGRRLMRGTGDKLPPSARLHTRRRARPEPDDQAEEPGPQLPDDPAEAMRALAARGEPDEPRPS